MADYFLKGVDPDQWKRFKAACNIRGCTIKQSFIDHINIIVGGFQPHMDQPKGHYEKPIKGGNEK